eukprot:7646124-Alexandrium_andersonii.AAC.1
MHWTAPTFAPKRPPAARRRPFRTLFGNFQRFPVLACCRKSLKLLGAAPWLAKAPQSRFGGL